MDGVRSWAATISKSCARGFGPTVGPSSPPRWLMTSEVSGVVATPACGTVGLLQSRSKTPNSGIFSQVSLS